MPNRTNIRLHMGAIDLFELFKLLLFSIEYLNNTHPSQMLLNKSIKARYLGAYIAKSPLDGSLEYSSREN